MSRRDKVSLQSSWFEVQAQNNLKSFSSHSHPRMSLYTAPTGLPLLFVFPTSPMQSLPPRLRPTSPPPSPLAGSTLGWSTTVSAVALYKGAREVSLWGWLAQYPDSKQFFNSKLVYICDIFQLLLKPGGVFNGDIPASPRNESIEIVAKYLACLCTEALLLIQRQLNFMRSSIASMCIGVNCPKLLPEPEAFALFATENFLKASLFKDGDIFMIVNQDLSERHAAFYRITIKPGHTKIEMVTLGSCTRFIGLEVDQLLNQKLRKKIGKAGYKAFSDESHRK
ncbi:hypothetical protein BDK51DRAFT_31174 [Blyttiomyces helicus]|uniref:Uncharacterized protein n=1 Tax=Blyttiomyces helicus TaxID=388810 RepID=A0A4P9VTQ6_9FUNG|nr:hypothetical protein BDK51DRAFT_31174 [Blyttiomyces helicus]|eukprot:RKO82919.1 hypothetical protein BDK51DRAFT_31174 [Blyttiomyces helicus]